MSEEYTLQITYQGIDPRGLTVMLNIRGATVQQFSDTLKAAEPTIKTLKPLPVKQYGGGTGQSARKQIVYLTDAPKCPKHGTTLNIREWTSPEGKVLHFWSCGEKTDGQFCREKVKPDPTPEQVAKWRELNGIELPYTVLKDMAKEPHDDQTICKMHDVKMNEISQKSGLPFHRWILDDGTQGFCNGKLVAAGKHA
jgi:hypothetical protein